MMCDTGVGAWSNYLLLLEFHAILPRFPNYPNAGPLLGDHSDEQATAEQRASVLSVGASGMLSSAKRAEQLSSGETTV